MGKFQWLLGQRADRTGRYAEGHQDVGLSVCDQYGVELEGQELVAWGAANLEWNIVERLLDVSNALREHVVLSPLTRICIGPKRIKTWHQAWKIVSNAAVTFEVALVVEESDPGFLRMRMTQYPLLQFPPLGIGIANLVRHYAGVELLEAIADLNNTELRGHQYSIRPHLVWQPAQETSLPEPMRLSITESYAAAERLDETKTW